MPATVIGLHEERVDQRAGGAEEREGKRGKGDQP